MEVNRGNHVFVTLLGRKYPVIQCQGNVNSFTNQGSSVSDHSTIETSVSEVNEETVNNETNNIIVEANHLTPPSLKLLASAALHETSAGFFQSDGNRTDNLSLTDPDEESSASGSYELDHSVLTDVNCMTEAVNLALSLDETANQEFEYQPIIEETPGSSNFVDESSIKTLNFSLPVGQDIDDNEDDYQISSDQPVAIQSDVPKISINLPEYTREPEEFFVDSSNVLNTEVLPSNEDDNTTVSLESQNGTSVTDNDAFVDCDFNVIPDQSFVDSHSNDQDQENVVSVTTKLSIVDYAQSEWKGTTYTANCLRNGYHMLMKNTGCNFLRQIRGDNYCALRATAFQILTQNVPILSSISKNWKENLQNLPDTLINKYGCSWLKQWTFADRLPYDKDNKVEAMNECMNFFSEQKELSEAMVNDNDRQTHFLALFNSMSYAEIKLFEALKLLMLKKAVELHECQSRGEDVPIFVWLLFARDTSEDPKSFMLNHLNLAGKSGGLEQVEMYLLGQALEVTLRVFRPSSVEQEDFVSHFPDHMIEMWEKIDLIAEDDRHYNILVK